MTAFDDSTPFILIARIKVKPGKVQEYLELATKTDAAVEASEPGMLHHTFDQDPEDSLGLDQKCDATYLVQKPLPRYQF